jgi:hypothetical protein
VEYLDISYVYPIPNVALNNIVQVNSDTLRFTPATVIVTNLSNAKIIISQDPAIKSGLSVNPHKMATLKWDLNNSKTFAIFAVGVGWEGDSDSQVRLTLTEDQLTPNIYELAIASKVEIGGTPEVTLIGDNSVNIANVPSVTLAGEPKVSVSSGTVNIGNTPTVNIASENTIAVTNQPGGNLTVAGTVQVGNVVNASIQSGNVNATIQNANINPVNMQVSFGSYDTPHYINVSGGNGEYTMLSSGNYVSKIILSVHSAANEFDFYIKNGGNSFYTDNVPAGETVQVNLDFAGSGIINNGLTILNSTANTMMTVKGIISTSNSTPKQRVGSVV